MTLNNKFYMLEIIDKQQIVIDQQHKSIQSLVNENVERESLINELMQGGGE